jgi:ABC-type glycerol-3-phosphate transport system substrate-binding protein
MPSPARRICSGAVFCLSLCLLFGLNTFSAQGLDISVNGSLDTRSVLEEVPWEPARIQLPYNAGSPRAYVLGEVAPLFTSAYRMEIETESGSTEISRDDLGDLLFESYLVPRDDGVELYTAGRRFRGVEGIDLYGEPAGTGELTIWLSWEGVGLLKEELSRFAEYHGIDLDLQQIPNTETKLTAALRGGGELPDLVMVQASSIGELAAARALQGLDYLDLSYAGEKGSEAFRLDETTWAAPFYCDIQLLFYNPELVPGRPEAGWTFDEFESLARRVREEHGEVAPASWNAYSAYWLSPFLYAFGKERLVEENGDIVIDEEPTRKAMEYLVSLRDRRLLRVSERDAMVSDFAAGRTAMILTGSYSIPHFRRLGIPFRPAPFPVNGEIGRAAASFIDYKGFGITRRSRSPVLARRFLQFLTGPGVQQRFCTEVHKLSARQDSWSVLSRELEYYEAMRAGFRQGAVVPPQRAYGIYKNTMWKLLRFVFSGRMGIEEVLATGQRIIDNKLQQARALQ